MSKSRRKEVEERLTTDLILAPDVSTLVKLGSIAIHADEMISVDGHQFDRIALKQLLDDPEIKGWLKAMDGLALIPKKRK
jgi:hypothetical protein